MSSTLPWEFAQSLRRLCRRPGQTLLTVLVLGGGMAAFLFTLLMLDGIVRARPPYAQPERIVNLNYARSDDARARIWIPRDEARALQEQLPALDRVAAYTEATLVLRDRAEPSRVDGALVGHQLFDVLGVAPALGRSFGPGDDTVSAPLVALLSDSLWRDRFGADPAIVGRAVHVDGRPATIIGVMPAAMSFPYVAQLWIPARLDDPGLATETFMLAGRLRADAGLADVRGEMQRWFADLAARKGGNAMATLAPVATPLLEWLVNPNTRYFVWLMVSCAAMVLLLAVSNAAYLLLAQVAQRHDELSTRAALGGSFARLAVALLLDAALVCAAATALALAGARLAAVWLEHRLACDGDPLPPWMDLGLSGSVFGWAAVVAAALTLLVAIGALWRVARLVRSPRLRAGGVVGLGSVRARFSSVFTGAQVALACALMLCAAVCLRTLLASLALPTGMATDPERLLGAQVALPAGLAPEAARRRALAIADRIRAEPGVESVSLATRAPGTDGGGTAVRIEGIDWGQGATRRAYRSGIDERFLDTAGIRLVSGRGFGADDVREARPVALIDGDFAAQLFGGAEPLGRRLQIDPGRGDSPWLTVVGVTAAAHPQSGDVTPAPDVFVPFTPAQGRYFALAIRTGADPGPLAARLPRLVAAIEPEAPVYSVNTHARALLVGAGDVIMITQILASLALLGLALAGCGLYATLALAVTRRTREIGLRRAVGASASAVALAVARHSMVALAVGLAVGALAGAPLARGLAARSDAAAAYDGLLFVLVLGAMLLAGGFAMLVPMRRALRVAPMAALRHE